MKDHQSPINQRLAIVATNISIALFIALFIDMNHAHAQNAQAQGLFNDGNQFMAVGELGQACTAFEASNRIEARAGTLLRLAECREQREQLASAWSAYRDAQNLAIDPKKRVFATNKANVLESQLSYLTVVVSEPSRIQGLVLTQNGMTLDPAIWNRELPIDGGECVMTGSAPGYEPWQKIVHVPRQSARLSVEVPALKKASMHATPEEVRPSRSGPSINPPAPGNPPPSAASSTAAVESTMVHQTVNISLDEHALLHDLDQLSTASAPSRSIALAPTRGPAPGPPQTASDIAPIIGASALVLLGSGAGCELWAESKYQAATSEAMTQSQRDSLYNDANARRHAAEAFGASGITTGGIAVWLYLRERHRSREPEARAVVHVLPSARGLAVSGQF
jgi:hypothetical protein